MNKTAIIGIGMTPVGEHWDKSLREIAAEAAHLAIEDAGHPKIDALYIGNAYGSSFNQQTQLGALIADFLGLRGIEAYSIEAGDASGGVALRAGHLAVLSGQVETVLVLGVEKATDSVGSHRVKARNVSLDADYEAAQGATLPALAALLMRRYMYEYDIELSAFEGFSINAHSNGKRNPYAMYRNLIKTGAFAHAPMIAEPVSLFDGAPDGDGAAAVIISRANSAQDKVAQPVEIVASAVTSDSFMLQERPDALWLYGVEESVNRALAQAQVTRNDLDLLELHDAFTILAAMSLEAAGFADRGRGWQLAQDGTIALNGRLPISSFGGLKSRGNPAGATGVYQAVEAVLQLRGKAGENQVASARTALIQNMGGLGSTVVSHILRI
jgi:acetyl-CoA C-acetyltransferase